MEELKERFNQKLYEAVLRDEAECRTRYRSIQKQIERYHGPSHTGREWSGTYDPRNAAWGFVTNTVAAMTGVTTRVFFGTRRPVAEERVEALEAFVDRWQRNTEWERELERGLVDMCFGTGVWVVEQRPQPGVNDPIDPAYMPIGRRLSPSLYGFDVDAESQDAARHKFHKVITDREPFLENAEREFGWDMEVCKALVLQSANAARDRQGKVNTTNREVIAYYSIWCPGHTLPDDAPGWGGMEKEERSRCHGVIYTYAQGQNEGLEPRIPIPYFGPRQGPYVTEGFMLVPDEAFHLGPLTASEGQINQLNAQARANDRASERKKTIAIFSAPTADGKAAVLDAVDGDVLSVPGFDKGSLVEVTTGGIDGESRARELELGIAVDRSLFTSDADRGEVTGVGTAAENYIAAQAGDKIDGLWKKRLASVIRQVALIVAWYGDQDERTVSMLDDGAFLGGMTPKQQLGALKVAEANRLLSPEEAQVVREELELRLETDQERGGGFDDLEIEVEVLGDSGVELARMQLIDQVVLNLPGMVQLAPVAAEGLKAYMKAKADLLHAPYLETFVDWDAAAAMVTQQQEAEQAQPAKPVAPRLQSMSKPPPAPGGRGGGGMNARKEASTARASTPKKGAA